MKLGEAIQQFRLEHGLSQRQFAVSCNLSNGYISMLERGENPKTKVPVTPTLPALQKIAQGMNMSLTDLFEIVDDMPVDISDKKEYSIEEYIAYLERFRAQAESAQIEFNLADFFSETSDYTAKEAHLLFLYRELNEEGQKKLVDYAADLAATGRYKE